MAFFAGESAKAAEMSAPVNIPPANAPANPHRARTDVDFGGNSGMCFLAKSWARHGYAILPIGRESSLILI
jgi:hypothetical protein